MINSYKSYLFYKAEDEDITEDPDHISQMRSKTLPPHHSIGRPQLSRKVTNLVANSSRDLEKVRNAKSQAERALKVRLQL